MYKSYEEAKAAALDVIERIYGGDKMDCVITESKLSKRARYISWGFRFHDTDSNGKFVENDDHSYSRKYAI